MKTTTYAAIGVVILVLLGFVVAPAMAANADNDLYTSKYAAIPNDTPLKGTLKGNLRAGFALDQTIVIYGPETVKVIAGDDGKFEADLMPGQYTIALADGNGGQTEFSSATIVAGQISFPEREILGHAATPNGARPDVIEILDAQYGAIEQRCREVLTQEAYDEIIPAMTHQDYQAGHVHAKKVGGWGAPHDFIYNGQKYQIVGNQAETAFIVHNYFCAEKAQLVTIIDVPAQTIHHPAVYETVCENYGAMVDVTAEVQAAIDGGDREFLFRNDMNPGGIFDLNGELLQQVQDPAPGIVKKVNINYKLNGVQKSIGADEYEEINL